MRVAFLGPDGSFSSRAARTLFPAATLLAVGALDEVVAALVDRQATAGVLPLLNRRAGPVPGGLGLFRRAPSVHVPQLCWLPIDLCLIGIAGASLDDIRVVRSHPMALKQAPSLTAGRTCEAFTSTASAASSVLSDHDPSVAALADRELGAALGLSVLAEAAPEEDNATLFAGLSTDPAGERSDEGLYLGPLEGAPAAPLVVEGGLALWSGRGAGGATWLGPSWPR